MSRLIFVFVFMLCLDIMAYSFLKNVSDQRKALPVNIDKHMFIYEKKDLVLDQDGEFSFDEYFGILSASKKNCRYSMEDDTIDIDFEGETLRFPYSFREEEVIEHETVIIKEVPVYIPNPDRETDNISHIKEEGPTPIAGIQESHIDQTDQPYMELSCAYYSFPKQTGLHEIISVIRNAVVSNEAVTIDYSSLNPDVAGTYPVLFISDHHTESVTVEIF